MYKKEAIRKEQVGGYTVSSTTLGRPGGTRHRAVKITDSDGKVQLELLCSNGAPLICREPLYEIAFACRTSEQSLPQQTYGYVKKYISYKSYRDGDHSPVLRSARVSHAAHKGGYVYLDIYQFLREMDIILRDIRKYVPDIDIDALAEIYRGTAKMLGCALSNYTLGTRVRDLLGLTPHDVDAAVKAAQAHCSQEKQCDTAACSAAPSGEQLLKEAVKGKTKELLSRIDEIDGKIGDTNDRLAALLKEKEDLQRAVSILGRLCNN